MIAVGGCGGTPVITADDDGARIALAPGDEIQVTLAGNATTGFSWELAEYDAAVIHPLGEPAYDADGGDVVGSGGEWTWTLQAVAAGESPVTFVYHRPWEDVPPESTFSFVAAVDQ